MSIKDCTSQPLTLFNKTREILHKNFGKDVSIMDNSISRKLRIEDVFRMFVFQQGMLSVFSAFLTPFTVASIAQLGESAEAMKQAIKLSIDNRWLTQESVEALTSDALLTVAKLMLLNAASRLDGEKKQLLQKKITNQPFEQEYWTQELTVYFNQIAIEALRLIRTGEFMATWMSLSDKEK